MRSEDMDRQITDVPAQATKVSSGPGSFPCRAGMGFARWNKTLFRLPWKGNKFHLTTVECPKRDNNFHLGPGRPRFPLAPSSWGGIRQATSRGQDLKREVAGLRAYRVQLRPGSSCRATPVQARRAGSG